MTAARLFVALTPPPAVRDALAAIQRPLDGVTWTPPHQLHVTLRFLGDVATDRIEALIERLAGIRVAAFVLPLEGLGAFPPNRPPRVVWMGVGRGHPRLFQLRQRLDDTLLAAGLTPDLRTFHPHVTLARVGPAPSAAVAQWLRAEQARTAPPFLVDGFELYASELHPAGAVHTLKARFPLAK